MVINTVRTEARAFVGHAASRRISAAISIIVGATLLLTTACSSPAKANPSTTTDHAGTNAAAAHAASAPVMSEGALRARLTELFGAHVALASAATGAAIGGRDAEFQAAAAALDRNSVQIAAVIGAAYGSDAQQAFLVGWRSHIQDFVDYAQGVAAKDSAKQGKAVDGLNQYALQIARSLNAANGLPTDGTVTLFKSHAVGLDAVIDAQAAGDWMAVYTGEAESMAHMQMLAEPIAATTAKKFPSRFPAGQ